VQVETAAAAEARVVAGRSAQAAKAAAITAAEIKEDKSQARE